MTPLSEAQAAKPIALDKVRLNAAVSLGILSKGQAERLAEFWVSEGDVVASSGATHADTEEIRFVRGFHDVFIGLGVVAFLVGLVFGLRDQDPPWFASALGAAAVWGLSEVLARRMRLALPSFILAISFTPLVLVAGVLLLEGTLSESAFFEREALLSLVLGLGFACIYNWRFRTPVSVTMVCIAGLLLAAFSLDWVWPGVLETHTPWIILMAGLGSFALAMAYDCRDLTRVTANSDRAFWLHLLAAPLIVHSLLALVLGDVSEWQPTYAYMVIGVFLFLGVVAIVVDRRALLVSGLGYFGFAIGALMVQADIGEDVTIAMTLVLLGSFILLLGTAWRRVRRVVLAPLTNTPVMAWLPVAYDVSKT